MEENYKEHTPNLSQRAYLISESLFVTNYLTLIAYGFSVLLITIVAIVGYSSNTTVQDFRVDTEFIMAIVISASIAFALIYYFMYRSNYKKLQDWQQDYLEELYIIVFDTTIPKGNTTSEKVLNLARTVIPELSQEYKRYADPANRFQYFVKSRLKPSKIEPASCIVNYKGRPYSFDIVVTTVDGYFIIKDFKDKVVTLEDLQELLDITKSNFKSRSSFQGTNIVRILCVAREYEQRLMQQETLERLMTEELEADFYLDLIIEEKTGFSVLWVGR